MQFEKGELLVGPIHPLESFCFVVEGSVSIYLLTEEGYIRYVSKSGEGILLGIWVSGKYGYAWTGSDVPAVRHRATGPKLSLSSRIDAVSQTLKENVLLVVFAYDADLTCDLVREPDGASGALESSPAPTGIEKTV